jgi:hypothetical protein
MGGSSRRAEHRYLWRSMTAMGMFLIAMLLLGPRGGLGTLTAMSMTIGVALPLVWVAYEFQHYVRALDEMQSRIEMQAAAIGFGLALLAAAIWGLAEGFGLLPSVSMALLLPLGVLLHGIIRFIQNRRFG